MAAIANKSSNAATAPFFARQLQKFGAASLVTLFASILLAAYLSPFAYMAVTSIKDKDQIVASATGSILPVEPVYFEYEGKQVELLKVPMEDGTVKELAIIEKGRRASTFVDPNDPNLTPIELEVRWRALEPVTRFAPKLGNFEEAWNLANFPRLITNTIIIAVTGLIGTVISSVCVAYAFARFPIPGKRLLFLLLISTIVLPRQVMLVPTYAFFNAIGWTGTWLPLIVPHFFSNAYNVFLLRQYFLQLPKELDEAAMIDGAGPFRILVSIIVPQSWPVIIAVALFHLVFAWNDYFEPLIYTLGKPEIQPIAVGIQVFNFKYDQQPHLIQATALMGMVVPIALFFLAQRFFMRGVVITGVDK